MASSQSVFASGSHSELGDYHSQSLSESFSSQISVTNSEIPTERNKFLTIVQIKAVPLNSKIKRSDVKGEVIKIWADQYIEELVQDSFYKEKKDAKITPKPKSRTQSSVRVDNSNITCRLNNDLCKGVRITNKTREALLPSATIIPINDNDGYKRVYDVKRNVYVAQSKQDTNHGEIKFYYFLVGKEGEQELRIFCTMKSRLSQAWQKLVKYRDKSFGVQVAKTVLDPLTISKVNYTSLIGNNKLGNTVVFKSNRLPNTLQLQRKMAYIQTFRANLCHTKDIKEIMGYFNISVDIPWEKLVGQLKIPVTHTVPQDMVQSEVREFDLICYLDSKMRGDALPGWDFLDIVENLKESHRLEKKLTNIINEELNDYFKKENYSFQYLDPTNLLEWTVDTFYDDINVSLYYNMEKIPWLNGEFLSSGSNITIAGVLEAIKRHRNQFLEDQEINAKNIQISCPGSGTFSLSYEPLASLIGARIPDKICEFEDILIKKGKNIFRLNPMHQIHLLENKLFIKWIKTCFIGTKTSEHKIFPLFWNIQDNAVPFEIDECYDFCAINKHTSNRIEEIGKLKETLCKPDRYVLLPVNKNNFYRQDKLNCSILKRTTLKQCQCTKTKCKRCLSFDDILLNENYLDKNTLGKDKKNSYNAKVLEDVLRELQKDVNICTRLDTKHLSVLSPYLTQRQADALKGFICITRLVQFLRMHWHLDEGDYNELYHLSNCKCHSDGWTYIVGDRVLAGTQKIEVFDVMAYKEGQSCYMFHVKKGCDATSTRAACSQVKVCADEICDATMLDVHGRRDIFDNFYQAATKEETNSIHRRLVKEQMENTFKTCDGFKRNMKSISGAQKFIISLALADANVLRWEKARNIDLEKDFSVLFKHDNDILQELKRHGLIGENNQITQGLIDKTKTEIDSVMSITKKTFKKNNWYNKIFQELGDLDSKTFLSTSYISKSEINRLSEHFSSLQNIDMNIKLQIFPVNIK